MKTYQEIFYEFLVSEGVLFQFMENLRKDKKGFPSFDAYCRYYRNNPMQLVNYAFEWYKTDELSYFWKCVHIKWLVRYKYRESWMK